MDCHTIIQEDETKHSGEDGGGGGRNGATVGSDEHLIVTFGILTMSSPALAAQSLSQDWIASWWHMS